MEPTTLHAFWIVFMVAVLAFFVFLARTLRSDAGLGRRKEHGRDGSPPEPSGSGNVGPEGRTDGD